MRHRIDRDDLEPIVDAIDVERDVLSAVRGIDAGSLDVAAGQDHPVAGHQRDGDIRPGVRLIARCARDLDRVAPTRGAEGQSDAGRGGDDEWCSAFAHSEPPFSPDGRPLSRPFGCTVAARDLVIL
jgi:hypothetical protein